MTQRSDLQPTLLAMAKAINDKLRYADPDYRLLLGAEIMLEHMYDWANGRRTDKDLLDLIEINVRNTQIYIDKKAKRKMESLS